MGIIQVVFLAIALSMDAFAVSITQGIKLKNNLFKKALFIGFLFGLFQAIMPIIGFYIGEQFNSSIESISQYVVFFILLFIGVKMLVDVFSNKETNTSSIYILAIATSIDAFSVGISLSLLNYNIIYSSLTIGIITFLVCSIGVKIGSLFGNKFENKAEIIGAIILIILALKILITSFI